MRTFAVLLFLILISSFSVVQTGTGESETIRGKTIDRSGTAISGVMVSAFDKGRRQITSVFIQLLRGPISRLPILLIRILVRVQTPIHAPPATRCCYMLLFWSQAGACRPDDFELFHCASSPVTTMINFPYSIRRVICRREMLWQCHYVLQRIHSPKPRRQSVHSRCRWSSPRHYASS